MVEIEFDSGVLQRLAEHFLPAMADQILDALAVRAAELYGGSRPMGVSLAHR